MQKIAVVSVVVLLALGVGYFAAKQTSQDKPHSDNKTVETSSPKTNGATLDLSGQQLTALPESVLSRSDITVLNISNNQLTSLPAGIAKLTNLVELNVENNRLESLPPELANMVWLKRLDISNNRLPVIEQEQIKSKLIDTEVKT